MKEVVATEKEAVTEEPETAARRSNRLNVKCVLQNPELPTGCEITALTIVLNYLGYDVDKLTMADKYLDKGQLEIHHLTKHLWVIQEMNIHAAHLHL